jgi:hypothetical protein
MKRNIVWTFLFIAMLLMSLAAVAKDNRKRDDCTCSNADIAGEWGTIMTGTIFHPTAGALPFSAVNKATYDSAGNYWGTQTRNINGAASRVTFEGTYILNSDCTGTKTTRSYDLAGTLLNTVDQDFILINNAKELIEVFTLNTLPNGNVVPTLITGNSKKVFPDSDNPGRHLGNCGH